MVEPYAAELPREFDGTGRELIDIDTALEDCGVLIVLVDHDVFKVVPLAERAAQDTRGLSTRAASGRTSRASRRAQVLRHESSFQDGGMAFAAVYAFRDEHGPQEVTDAVYGPQPSPAVGATIELAYPDGRPDLARPRRLLTWLWVYATLLFMLGMLTAKLMGWLD
jgi:hypothetical protein